METQLTNCLKCQTELVHIHHHDLTGGRLDLEPALLAKLNAILAHFELSVCPNCGLALLNTTPELKALAVEINEEKGGHS